MGICCASVIQHTCPVFLVLISQSDDLYGSYCIVCCFPMSIKGVVYCVALAWGESVFSKVKNDATIRVLSGKFELSRVDFALAK